MVFKCILNNLKNQNLNNLYIKRKNCQTYHYISGKYLYRNDFSGCHISCLQTKILKTIKLIKTYPTIQVFYINTYYNNIILKKKTF